MIVVISFSLLTIVSCGATFSTITVYFLGGSSKYRLQAGDIVLTEGGDHDKLGRGALWSGEISNCIHQNHIFRVRLDCDKLLPVYFVYYLQTQIAKAYFLSCAKKTTNLASINMSQLKALPVPVPPLSLQRQFEQIVTATSRNLALQKQSLERVELLIGSLQEHLFNGQTSAADLPKAATNV